MSENEASMDAMLTNLVAAADQRDPSEVLAISTKILNLTSSSASEPQNRDAMSIHEPLPEIIEHRILQTHCRALISLHKYNDVISFCNSLPSDSELLLEKSYALYKLGQYAACRDAIFQIASALQTDDHHKNNDNDSDDNDHDRKNNFMSDEIVRGLEHLLAQCHYRLHETNKATDIYNDFVHSSTGGNGDTDEHCEIVTNAMAASLANNSINIKSPIIEEFQHVFAKELESANSNNQDEYPYEMVNNYATNLLLTSTNMGQTKKAMELLHTAQEECKAIFEDGEDSESQEEGKSASPSPSFMKEIMPIKSNIALAKMLSGDLNGAMRSYLELSLSSKPFLEQDSSFNSGGGILATENNLVVLNMMRGSSLSVYDLLKKLPDLSNHTGGVRGSRSGSSAGINPHQTRIIMYNRALLFYSLGKTTEVWSLLKALKASLSVTSSSTEGQSQSQVHSNGKKKKRKNGTGHLIAHPVRESERVFWECRIAILGHEMSSKSNETGSGFETMKNQISTALNQGQQLDSLDQQTLEYALAELQLYEAQKLIQEISSAPGKDKNKSNDTKTKVAAALEALPPSIRNRPATVACLCALYRSMGMDEKVELTLKASEDSDTSIVAQKRVADFKLRLGMYEEAAVIYESIIDGTDASAGNQILDEEDLMECTAGLIKALSYIDMEKAMDIADGADLDLDSAVDDHAGSDILHGEELEAMPIPRLHKGAGSLGAGRSHKIFSSRGGAGQGTSTKKSQEAILRQRAKKRESHLEKLQKQGRYNPDKPTKPDPERWIPKNQRSYNRRGRKGRSKFLGAQGGGTGFGADKEAAKLDAYARAIAKAEGKDLSGGQPSTAHMSVSSSGRRRR